MTPKSPRRSIIAWLVGLFAANKVSELKCCGTCKHLIEQCELHYNFGEDDELAMPVFGWCDLVPDPQAQSATDFGSYSLIDSLRIIGWKRRANRHFLMTCPKWEKRKKGN